MAAEKPKLVTIVGPTGSGKSTLGWHLAKEFGGEIISADSVQVYRGLDIGSAKPSAEQRRLVIHHLIDILDLNEEYSAAQFRDQAKAIIQNLHKKKIPIFVIGGTGLYLKALTGGIFRGPGADPHLRQTFLRRAKEDGIEMLHRELSRVDRKAASRIHPRDTIRIIRALEVYHTSGRPISVFQKEHGFAEKDFDILKIGLFFPRDELYRRIDLRAQGMIDRGWVEEVRTLLNQGFSPRLKSLQSLGYKQIVSFLQGEITMDQAIQFIQRDTRQYAKRQMTWFRGDPEILWFRGDLEEIEPVRKKVAGFWDRNSN